MNNRLINWVKPFITFGIAVALLAGWIFLNFSYDLDFFTGVDILVFYLFFILIVEAASQANPDQVNSPIKNFFDKYSNRRDKAVVIIANSAVLIILLLISTISIHPFLKMTLLIAGAIATYYGICYLFGTQELIENIVPRIIKKRFNKTVGKNNSE